MAALEPLRLGRLAPPRPGPILLRRPPEPAGDTGERRRLGLGREVYPRQVDLRPGNRTLLLALLPEPSRLAPRRRLGLVHGFFCLPGEPPGDLQPLLFALDPVLLASLDRRPTVL